MPDIAALGLAVDFRPVEQADAALQNLVRTGAQAEAATKRVEAADKSAAAVTQERTQALKAEYAEMARRVNETQRYTQAAQGATEAERRATQMAQQSAASQRALGESFKISEAGASRLNGALGPLVAEVTGADPKIVNLSRAIGLLGISGPIVAGALTAASLLGLGWRKYTEDARAAQEQTDELVQSLAQAYRAAQSKTPAGMAKTSDELVANLRALLPKDFLGVAVGNADTKAVQDALDALRQFNKERREAGALDQNLTDAMNGVNGVLDLQAALHRKAAADAKAYTDQLEHWLKVLRDIQAAGDPMRGTLEGIIGGAGGVGPVGTRGPAPLMSGIKIPDSIRKRITPEPGTGTDWAQAAQIGGGIILGTGLAGNGYAAAGLSGAMSLAAQGAMLGSVVPGIGTAVGAVVGGVAGLVSGLFGHAKEAAEARKQLAEAKKQFDLNLSARMAAAGGNTQLAEDLRLQAQQEKELADARKAGMAKNQIATLEWVQALERQKVAQERANQQTEAAAAAAKAQEEAQRRLADAIRSTTEDLTVRGLRAVGRGDAADTAALGFAQAREWAQALRDGLPDDTMRQLAVVQAIEKQALENQQWLKAQTDAIRSAADAQIQVAQQQLRVAQDALRVHEQAAREARAVADSLAGYGASLLTGSFATQSSGGQLASARSQFEALRTLALGGDASAAQSLAGAGNTLLGASRAYNATGAGYVADFQRVQQTVETVRAMFATRATFEERMLAELQKQTAQLQAQQETIRASADATIAAYQAEFNDKQNRLWEMLQSSLAIETNTNQHAADQNEINTLRTNTAAIVSSYQAQLEAKDAQIASLLSMWLDAMNGYTDAVVGAIDENTRVTKNHSARYGGDGEG